MCGIMDVDKPYEYVGAPEKYEKYCYGKLKEITPYLRKDEYILDGGCGGEEHPYCFLKLEKLFPNLVGADLNNHWHPKIIKENLLELSFKENQFDSCICLDVLEHIEDWQKALDELIRVSRRQVIILVPTSESKIYTCIWNIARKCIGINNRVMFGHYREFHPDQIMKFKNPKIASVSFKKINSAAPFPEFLKKTKMLYSGVYIIDMKNLLNNQISGVKY